MNRFNDINSFINWVEKQKRFSPKVSLDKMKFYCSLFDHPEQKFKAIHVTGTNGKGSVVAFLRSILMTAGLNVGTFTSPYITYFNERIQYNGTYISDEDLLKYANRIIDQYNIIENSEYELPTFFEFITLLCFLYFAELKTMDLAIIEVGMGGRLDATNVVNSIIAVITNVSLEHTQILGDTTIKITNEKLGIVRNGVPLICGIKDESLQEFVKEECQKRSSKVYLTAPRAIEIKKMDIYGSEFTLEGYENTFKIALPGFHQIENAQVAITVIEVLNQIIKNNKWNFPISNVILSEGLSKAIWRGRFDIISSDPLIVTDGAHNIDGITRICEFIKQLNYPYKRAVIAISKDKDKDQMINLLDQTFDEIIFTKYSYSRSAEANELFMYSHNPNKKYFATLEEVNKYVYAHQVPFTIYMGSLYLVTDVLKANRMVK